MPHTACSSADDDLPASSSGSLAPSDVDSIPTASTPRAAEDAEVGSQEGTHKEEAREAPQGSLPDFAPDSTPDSIKEEHRTIMSAVIQKVQLAKRGLTEACNSLLTGFEVRSLIYVK